MVRRRWSSRSLASSVSGKPAWRMAPCSDQSKDSMGPSRSGSNFRRRESGPAEAESEARAGMPQNSSRTDILRHKLPIPCCKSFRKIQILFPPRKHKLRRIMPPSIDARFLIDNPHYKLIEEAIWHLHQNAGNEISLRDLAKKFK